MSSFFIYFVYICLPETLMKSNNISIINDSLKKINKDIKAISRKGILRHVPKKTSESFKNNVANISSSIESFVNTTMPNLISAKEKFITTFGVEYTFLQRFNSKKSDSEISEKIIKGADKRQVWNKKVHADGEHVIEFASPVHKNWQDMLKHYRIIKNHARKNHLVYKRGDCTGGGAHIHMGLPKKWSTEFKLQFLKNFYVDIALRPYLNWFFNDTLDDINASSMFTSHSGSRTIMKIIDPSYFNVKDQQARSAWLIDLALLSDLSTKDYACRYDSEFETIELRIFKMVENEKMLEDYVEFANAYFRYIYNYTKNNYYSYSYDHEINLQKEYSVEKTNWFLQIPNTLFDRFKSKKYTIKRFNEFVEQIGLKSYKYKKYIKNYEARLSCYKNKEVKMDFDMTKDFPWPSRTYSGEKQSGGIEFKNSSSDLGDVGNEENQDTSINIDASPDLFLNGDSIEISEDTITETVREAVNEVVSEVGGEEGCVQESSQQVLREISPSDPIQKLNFITKILTSEVVSKLTSTPRRGQKITIKVSTTW